MILGLERLGMKLGSAAVAIMTQGYNLFPGRGGGDEASTKPLSSQSQFADLPILAIVCVVNVVTVTLLK